MRDDLLEKLETWHEEDEYEAIVDAIMEIPAEERDYELISHLGRALNNLERYEEAIEQFLLIEEEGKDDPLWHYRIGLAYYYLDQYDDAQKAFEEADRLDPGDEDTLDFLESIASLKEEEDEEDEESEDEEEEDEDEEEESSEDVEVTRPVLFDTDFDYTNFWDDSDPNADSYVSAPPTDKLIESVEESLVFKLPDYYIQMMKQHNGGVPYNRQFHTNTGSIQISGILGIGREKSHSLCGESGSRSLIESGGYPEFGVVIALAESGVIMLDYRETGNDGEPEVVHVDQGSGHKVTKLAPSFEAFVRGLVKE
ncbi:SMI1/KNR4 family protein [Paenibacillus dakarensis]|uniref:SMI1/KNR4 family protein n=1 Tax=Paenibacillus dakarensis TaxID=1527293 RepID=UPI0006D5B21D|nr:SMI1/KNR4 family protein [Paenibacillus dakarensis]